MIEASYWTVYVWRKYDQTACIPVRNQTWIIQCPKRAVSEWKFVTNWDQFSDKLQSWDSASFIPNERSISEVHLSVVIFISTPSHTYYRATFQDLSKILWIHVNSHRAKRSREGTRDSAYLAHYPHCVQVRGHCTETFMRNESTRWFWMVARFARSRIIS